MLEIYCFCQEKCECLWSPFFFFFFFNTHAHFGLKTCIILALPFMVGFRVGRVSVIYIYTHGVKQFWFCVNVCDRVSVNELCFGKEVSSMGYIQYLVLKGLVVCIYCFVTCWTCFENHDKCILSTIKISITQPKLFFEHQLSKKPILFKTFVLDPWF